MGVPSAGLLNGTDIDPASRTAEMTANLTRLEVIPFGIINVVGGYHTAMVLDGFVYEVYWASGPKTRIYLKRGASRRGRTDFGGTGSSMFPLPSGRTARGAEDGTVPEACTVGCVMRDHP
jgi:hypothetical protein